MSKRILCEITATIPELKTHPVGIVDNANGETVAILHRGSVKFYCVPAESYEKLIDELRTLRNTIKLHKD
jgi:antitoxin StbD